MGRELEASQSAKSAMFLSMTSVTSFIIVSINPSVGCCCTPLLDVCGRHQNCHVKTHFVISDCSSAC